MSYAASYPRAAERPHVFPQEPGFIGKHAAVPEFRWVPPVPFRETYPVSMSPSGLFPYGPAYASPPQTGCPSCLRGVGELTEEQQRWGLIGTVAFSAVILGALALYAETRPVRRR